MELLHEYDAQFFISGIGLDELSQWNRTKEQISSVRNKKKFFTHVNPDSLLRNSAE